MRDFHHVTKHSFQNETDPLPKLSNKKTPAGRQTRLLEMQNNGVNSVEKENQKTIMKEGIDINTIFCLPH